ncbi:MAG: sn-glycerol-3-phosphate ABC transporter ATP-binding protein UgpC [Rhizobiales bacterium]|nr:sn-glycerol-3-phosphate ABC transporter ATP-binding protein UgpC [Hyphomicrobiales bacterium]
MSYVKLERLAKRFDDVEVIRNVDLEIEKEEFTVFVGPSGCGKTTLLRLIAGLEEANGGEIHIDGQRVDQAPPAKRGIAMVFQNYALYPHMTVYENMSFGLRISKFDSTVIRQRVERAADILQIREYLQRKPRALSGGQRQRVAIGRAIVREPKVFLFDEPLSNLDAKLRVQMRVELTALHRQLKATMIYVTHDQVEAMTMADKIVVMNQGNIEQVGRPLDLYRNPKNKFVASFIGSPAMNFLEGRVSGRNGQGVEVTLDDGGRVFVPCGLDRDLSGQAVTLGIRPEDLRLGAETGSAIAGQIFNVERLGGDTYIYVKRHNGGDLTVHAPGDVAARLGDEVPFAFDGNKCHLFNASGDALKRSPASG